MLSPVPAIFPSETTLQIPPMDFESGFTPWDSLDYCSFPFNQLLESVTGLTTSKAGPGQPNLSPVSSDSGSDPSCYHAGSDSGSDSPNRNSPSSNENSDRPKRNSAGLDSGSGEPDQIVSIMEARKRKRMESNRESARRSRMRKQKHLEDLRNEVNRLKLQNRECTNRLRFVLHHCHLVQRDNDRLRSESFILQRRLMEICKILQFRRQLEQQRHQQQQQQQYYSSSPSASAWACNNFTSINEQIPSLIT